MTDIMRGQETAGSAADTGSGNPPDSKAAEGAVEGAAADSAAIKVTEKAKAPQTEKEKEKARAKKVHEQRLQRMQEAMKAKEEEAARAKKKHEREMEDIKRKMEKEEVSPGRLWSWWRVGGG